jgi:hypothetical protein
MDDVRKIYSNNEESIIGLMKLRENLLMCNGDLALCKKIYYGFVKTIGSTRRVKNPYGNNSFLS